MTPEVLIVDYHKGNLSSVERSLAEAGARVQRSDDAQAIASARALVLPGVGSFEDAMNYISRHGQDEAIREAIQKGACFLGICLGQHLLFEKGNESRTGEWVDGLGLLPGNISRLESSYLKVPHVGWNQLLIDEYGQTCPLLQGVESGAHVYFTHSYATAADVDTNLVASTSDYTRLFASTVWRDRIFGVQFHPEKSSAVGMRILSNFVHIAKDTL